MRRPELTRELARHARAVRQVHLPSDVRRIALHCILDWYAVTLAGLREPCVAIAAGDAMQEGGAPHATIAGQARKGGMYAAALVNGTAAHALDYDDVNIAIAGHPTAVILPAVLALAEARGASGAQLIEAFVAGYEVACRAGRYLGDSHYERGFHATATAGVIGVAAACGRLLRLSEAQMQTALALAATQAAGLKCMFGTMAKPLHAGLAARNGLMAARLAALDFDGGQGKLEAPQGYGAALSPAPDVSAALATPAAGMHIRNRLFKYHAACYGVNAGIECARAYRREHPQRVGDIARIVARAHVSGENMCNIAKPRVSAQAKFSLRLNIAFGLLGFDTADVDVYTPERLNHPEAVRLRDLVDVVFVDDLNMMESELTILTEDGERHIVRRDAGQPAGDLDEEELRLTAKFDTLCVPILGAERAQEIQEDIWTLAAAPNVERLARALAPGGGLG
jgi:2-methylcitrate dehydratase PrpD